MKLLVSRSCENGNYLLNCQIELSEEEKSLFEKFKLMDYPALSYISSVEAKNSYNMNKWTLGVMIHGIEIKRNNILAIQSLERRIRKSCPRMIKHLKYMSNFNGQETFEYGNINTGPEKLQEGCL
jgi:hypothetical protein